MIKVVIRSPNPQHLQIALRRLRKLCEREGVMREIKRKQAYEKPSERRRRERRRVLKIQQKENEERKQKYA